MYQSLTSFAVPHAVDEDTATAWSAERDIIYTGIEERSSFV